MTASELIRKIERYACGFQKCGLGPGSRIYVHTRNGMESMVAALGAAFAGGTLVMAKSTLISSKFISCLNEFSPRTHCNENLPPNFDRLDFLL